VTTCFLGSGSRYSRHGFGFSYFYIFTKLLYFCSRISIGTTAVFFLVAIVLLVSPRGETSKGDVESEISVRETSLWHLFLGTA
jgi:hypothetical protein